MRFALMTEPQQGLGYNELRALAEAAEIAGFESFFRSDHYTSFPGAAGLPTTDAWSTLAGLARETSQIGLGVLVSPVTFRPPGNLIKVVTTVDEMSGGRVELGLGAGWNEIEHLEHGLPFPPLGERMAMLEEQLAIVHGLWTEEPGWSYEGRHWVIQQSRLAPHPPPRAGRRHPNLIVGGEGKPRMARLAATYADEFNYSGGWADEMGAAFDRVRQACVAFGRDPDELTYSVMVGVIIGDTEADVRDRVRALLAMIGSETDAADGWLAERRLRWVLGTPSQAAERIAELEAAGAQRVMLQDLLPRDLAMVRELGAMLRSY